MTTVAHYLERWLEVSAGFVAAHVEHSRHGGVVISRDGWACLDAFPYQPRHSLHRLRDRAPDRWKPLATKAELAVLLARHHADLVHVHFGYAAADVIAATSGSRPFVLSLHGHDITGRLRDEPGRYDEVARAVDAVIVPSAFLADTAAAAGFNRSTIHVIPSGIDTKFFTPTPVPAGPPVVGFVGRLVAKKGLDVLLKAWPTILAAVPAAQLHVLGDGPLAGLLVDADDSITWTRPESSRRHEQVRDALRAATVVTTPSHTAPDGDSESLLLVNLEAGATGRPVVSTRHGGIPEYVDDGRTGVLVEEGNADALAAAVIELHNDPARATAIGQAASDHVQQWDVRAMTARVDDLYDELLRRK